MSQSTTDPRAEGPKPPQPAQQQPPTGRESEMEPRPDYGEGSYVGHTRLLQRKALITGGDSGIGRAVALAFAREGADVAINYLESHDDARETARIVEDAAREALPIALDISTSPRSKPTIRPGPFSITRQPKAPS